MTEQNLGEPSSQNQSVSAPVSTPAQPVAQQPAEKVFTQTDMDALAGRIRSEERSRHASAPVSQPAAQNVQQVPQQNAQQPTQMGGMNQLTAEQIQRMIDERAPQAMAQQMQQQQIHNTNMAYVQRLEAGKAALPDFDTKVAALNLVAHQELIPLLNSVDSSITADVTYDLANNPQKFANLKVLNMMNPQLAAIELNKLAESVKQNKAASQQKTPNNPLSQVQTSVTGTDNGSATVSDLRTHPNLRA